MKKLVIFGFLAFALSACQRTEPDLSGADDRPLVAVNLTLEVAPEENGMPLTKADYEPDDPAYDASQAVKSAALLQFEWVDASAENARLIYQYYTTDWATSKPVVAASSLKNTLVVVANVAGRIPVQEGISYGTFLEKLNYNLLDSLEDPDGKGVWYSQDGSPDRYLRMSGMLEVEPPVTQASLGTVTLRRNCAKVVVHIRNEAPAADNLVLDAVQVRDVNRKYYYFTGDSFRDEYSSITPFRIDGAKVSLSAIPFQPDGVTKSLDFFVPLNLRGKNAEIGTADTPANHSEKSLHPVAGATCISIYGRYDCTDPSDPSNGTQIAYTYYLGANLTDDFNLAPNCKYNYTFVIPGKGSATDGRVDDMKTVYLADANGYMLHPPVQEGTVRRYAIPVRRAAVFWNQGPDASRDVTVGYYGGSSEEEYCLSEHSRWTAEVVWNDVFVDGKRVDSAELLETAEGVGFDPDHAGSQPYLTVKVSKGMYGNALVAIRKVGSSTDRSYGDILWSWHLWVTDYNPDVPVEIQDEKYIYKVPGGEVHRYGGTIWHTTYENAVAMDRNMGAITTVWGVMSYSSHGAYYQQGRKDPLYTNGLDSYYTQEVYTNGNHHISPGNIRYSIHHPTVYLRGPRGSGWVGSGDNDLSDINKPWNDIHVDDPLRPAKWVETGKSLYDPCPPGWCVPMKGSYDDLRTGSNATRHRDWDAVNPGVWYYPEGYDNREATGAIYFPAAGHIIWDGGTHRFRFTEVDLYTSIGNMYIDKTRVGVSGTVSMRPSAYPVRCIKKNDE